MAKIKTKGHYNISLSERGTNNLAICSLGFKSLLCRRKAALSKNFR
jgi:hypothetical protein